jgi:hypothetical protein
VKRSRAQSPQLAACIAGPRRRITASIRRRRVRGGGESVEEGAFLGDVAEHDAARRDRLPVQVVLAGVRRADEAKVGAASRNSASTRTAAEAT